MARATLVLLGVLYELTVSAADTGVAGATMMTLAIPEHWFPVVPMPALKL